MPEHRFKIEKPYYPIVYVRGYAMRAAEREETFNDTYYGFSATLVEKRQAPAPQYFEADVFEGQLIRLMKIKDYGYADSVNRGLEFFHSNPSRSVWIARFYDQDVSGTRFGRSRTTRRICIRSFAKRSRNACGPPGSTLERTTEITGSS